MTWGYSFMPMAKELVEEMEESEQLFNMVKDDALAALGDASEGQPYEVGPVAVIGEFGHYGYGMLLTAQR